MSLKILSKCAGSLTDETLGTVVFGMVEDGDLSADQFGAMVRTYLSVASLEAEVVSVVSPAVASAVVAAAAPPVVTNPQTRAELLRIVYGSFETFRRRSATSLANATGLTEANLLSLISGNADFRVSNGNSGRTFVSVRGVN